MPLTEIEKERIRINSLADAATVQGTNTLPPVPHLPLPDDVVKRMPQLKRWYDQWHQSLEQWRMQCDRAIRGPGI